MGEVAVMPHVCICGIHVGCGRKHLHASRRGKIYDVPLMVDAHTPGENKTNNKNKTKNITRHQD